MSSENRFQEYRAYLENFLKDYFLKYHAEPQKVLYDAMTYSLFAGGKRLRPTLTFEFCRLCSGEWQKAAPLAAALEMIHTYSLIHDDLPCMDNDDYRRGRLTNHKVYGEAIAVLAGDALLTDAFALAATAALPGEKTAQAIRVLAESAGSSGMVGGQVLDIMSEERACTEQEVLDIQSRKTGALFEAACLLGAIAGGASDAQMDAAKEYASCMGLAFQIRDDMLDVIGTYGELGKATGADAGKNTFVQLYGLDRCEELVSRYTDRAIAQLREFEDASALASFTESLVSRRT